MLRFDHVVMAVQDFDETAARLLATHGLASVAGGDHAGHGTGNRIVPLGPEYIELMAVVDRHVAEESPLGQWVMAQTHSGDRLAALCVQTDAIERVAARLRLEVVPMSRTRPDGSTLSWRLAGLQEAMGHGLPFFIQWDGGPDVHPGRAVADHTTTPAGLAWVDLGGDPTEVDEWLGPHDLDLRVVRGAQGVQRIGIATTDGEIVL